MLLAASSLFAQNREVEIEMRCQQDNRLLVGVTVFLPAYEMGTSSNEEGIIKWVLPAGLEPATKVVIRHIGFVQKTLQLSDFMKSKLIYLEEKVFESQEVVIQSTSTSASNMIVQQIDRDELGKTAEKNLANLIRNTSGVETTGMGEAMAKPVIHGLYGDRISLVKNGNPIQAHLWSREHAPPISGLQSRSNIELYKGASTVLWTEQAIGGTVLIEPRMPGDYGYKNAVFTDFQTNGTGFGVGAEYGISGDQDWKIGWYSSLAGNQQTPEYRIENSARQTHEFQAAYHSNLTDKLSVELQSGFNFQEFGIPTVAHIGNLADLQESLNRGRPLESATAGYGINEPKQRISHIDLQSTLQWSRNENQTLRLLTAFQLNNRQEFDIRRGGRSNLPVTDMQLMDVQIKPIVFQALSASTTLEWGLDWNWQKNNNIAGTGIKPFIPNYSTTRIAAFASLTTESDDWSAETGLRVGYRYFNARYFDFNNTLINSEREFVPFSAVAAFTYKAWEAVHLKFQSGLGYRNPNVAELYASGLHHGASVYEIGNPNLQAELGWKSLIQADIHLSENILLTTTLHSNRLNRFVYLAYTGQDTFTIRGAYPVFNYRQDAATLTGLDIDATIGINRLLQYRISGSYLRANRDGGLPLPDIPPFNMQIEQRWQLPFSINEYAPQLSLQLEYVDRQTRFLSEELFADPPASFTLLHAGITLKPKHSNSGWKLSLQANNLLNQQYRRYLNRLRFFVHQPGFNLLLNLEINI